MRLRSLLIFLLLLTLAMSCVAQTPKHRVLLDVNTVNDFHLALCSAARIR